MPSVTGVLLQTSALHSSIVQSLPSLQSESDKHSASGLMVVVLTGGTVVVVMIVQLMNVMLESVIMSPLQMALNVMMNYSVR